MGYGVGFQDGRWIGYMVAAECDWPDCHEKIDHGMAYKCETHERFEYKRNGVVVGPEDEWDEENEIFEEGCGLYFCGEHMVRHDEHEKIEPKPDSLRWLWWLVNEDSWKTWREENPELAEAYQEAIKDFEPDAELLEEQEMNRTA